MREKIEAFYNLGCLSFQYLQNVSKIVPNFLTQVRQRVLDHILT